MSLGNEYCRWGQYVSPKTFWNKNFNPFTEYKRSFGVIPYNLANNKMYELANTGKNAVVLDLLSSVSALRSIKNEVFWRSQATFTGIALGLRDERFATEVITDNLRGITQVTGDIRYPTVLRKITEQLNGEKIDVILQRGWGAIPKLPLNKIYQGAVFNWAFANLSAEAGVMVVQTPNEYALKSISIDMDHIVETLITQGHQAGYDPQPSFSGEPLNLGCFWLVKNNEVNPLLSPNS